MPSDSIPKIVIGVVMLCWLTLLALFLFHRKPPSSREKKRDSTARFGIALEAVGIACIWMFRRPIGRPVLPLSSAFEMVLAILTIVLSAGSCVLVVAGVRTLGPQWTAAARVLDDHILITHGPYRIVRNPIYTGMMGLLICTGLAISRWWILPPALVLFWIGTLMRVRKEERLLREAFGAEFDLYIQRVPSLVPFLHLLRREP